MTGPVQSPGVALLGAQPDGPALSRVAWDRAGLHRSDEAWLAEAWTRARVLVISPDSATPVDADGRPALRPAAEAPEGSRRLLGVVDGVPHFTVTAAPDVAEPRGAQIEGAGVYGADARTTWRTLRDVGADVTDLGASLFATAIGLEQWHQRHPRCPRCGGPTREAQAGWTRVCEIDGSHHFPRTDPAVIMLVDDGAGRVLLGRNKQWNEGRFSALAGFVEPGESLEEAVAREVYEEVGVGIRDIHYVASQPWPFPASLMLGYRARLDGDSSISLDTVEMAEAGWFTREQIRRAVEWSQDAGADDSTTGTRLRALPPTLSIARFLIDGWLADDC